MIPNPDLSDACATAVCAATKISMGYICRTLLRHEGFSGLSGPIGTPDI